MLTRKSALNAQPLPPDTRKAGGSFAKVVGSFVPKIAGKVFEKYGFHSAEIMTAWDRVAGPEFAAFTEPEKIRWPREFAGQSGQNNAGDAPPRPGATLVLRVEPARALDAEYRARELIERVNQYFGYRAVETVKLIQAPLTRARAAQPAAKSTGTTTAAPRPASENKEPGELKSALDALWASVSAPRRQG